MALSTYSRTSWALGGASAVLGTNTHPVDQPSSPPPPQDTEGTAEMKSSVTGSRSSAPERMLTVAEVAQELRVCERSVRRWIDQEELRHHQFGRTIRVSRQDLMTSSARAGNESPGSTQFTESTKCFISALLLHDWRSFIVGFSPFSAIFHLGHLESHYVQNRHDGKSAYCFSRRRTAHSPKQRGTATPHASQDGLKREAVRMVRGAAFGSDPSGFAYRTHSFENDLSSAARPFPGVLGLVKYHVMEALRLHGLKVLSGRCRTELPPDSGWTSSTAYTPVSTANLLAFRAALHRAAHQSARMSTSRPSTASRSASRNIARAQTGGKNSSGTLPGVECVPDAD